MASCFSTKEITAKNRKFLSGNYLNLHHRFDEATSSGHWTNATHLSKNQINCLSDTNCRYGLFEKKAIISSQTSQSELIEQFDEKNISKFSSNSNVNLSKKMQKHGKIGATLKALLLLMVCFFAIVFVELLFPLASAFLSIIIALGIVVLLVLLFRFFTKKAKPSK